MLKESLVDFNRSCELRPDDAAALYKAAIKEELGDLQG